MTGFLRTCIFNTNSSEREMARQQSQSDQVFPNKYMDRSTTPKPEQLSELRSITPKPTQQDRLAEFMHTPAGERTARYVDRTPTTNHMPESGYKSSNITDTGYCSANRTGNNAEVDNRVFNRQIETPRMNMAHFDPNKYQDRAQTPSNSSGWSCSASIHSNDTRGGVISPTQGISDHSPIDMTKKPSISTVSDSSSHDGNEFSLQNTKKVLYFDPESNSHHGSLNEQYSHQEEHTEQHYHSFPLRQADNHHNYRYTRSNSVDELEMDRPQKAAAGARSNSVDDILDYDDSREQRTRNVLPNRTTNSQRPVSSNIANSKKVLSNYNNCASASQSKNPVGKVVKPKTDSQQPSEISSPLNSARLRPIRQRTRNAVVNILDNGEVCLEFVKQKHKEEKVVEVFVISQEGTRVCSAIKVTSETHHEKTCFWDF